MSDTHQIRINRSDKDLTERIGLYYKGKAWHVVYRELLDSYLTYKGELEIKAREPLGLDKTIVGDKNDGGI